MWSLWRHGEELRADGLTLAQIVEVERQTGLPLHQMRPPTNASHAKALAAAFGVSASEVRLTDFTRSEDNLPRYFEDGAPVGGRPFDGWIVAGVKLGFTPDQVRNEFTLRDLELISAAFI